MKQPPKSATSLISERNRLINSILGISVYLFLSLLLPHSAKGQINATDVAKSWKYDDVYLKTPGDQFRRVGAHDVMTLRLGISENTFSYALQLENIKARGNWELTDSTLIFTYQPVDTGSDQPRVVRRFKIIHLSNEAMLFREVTTADKPAAYFAFSRLAE